MRLWVEPSPRGGYAVRAEGSPVPLSRHDTEGEAHERLAAYVRGLSRPGADAEMVRLRDGSEVVVRAVRPEDKPLFVAGWERFSEESRFKRFLRHKKALSTQELAFFTEIDHVDHLALGALEPRSGNGVGVARCLRDPERPHAAEAAVAIIDAWQGRGLGTVLLERLCDAATERGITCFTGTLLTSNKAMLRLFQRLGRVHVHVVDRGTMTVDVELSVSDRECLRVALRSAATGHVGRNA